MKRYVSAAAALGAVAALVALGPASAQSSSTTGLQQKAYDATALAVPVNPTAGTHDYPIPVRLYTTRADVSNPPTGASGRGARTDLGLLAQFAPPQADGGLGPAADSSTRDQNSSENSTVQDHGAVYTAHADPSPYAWATAVGRALAPAPVAMGALVSKSTARATNALLSAAATTTMQDATFGPLHAATASYDASVQTTGLRGGARGVAAVSVSGATVAGIPVVLTATGVQVDKSRVPASAVPAATKAVADGFARSGYMGVRVTQPVVTTKPDGSYAGVSGGGIELLGRSDNQSSYFVDVTVLSGSVSVAVGGSYADSGGLLENLGPVTGAPAPAAPGAPTTIGISAPGTPPVAGTPPNQARLRTLASQQAGGAQLPAVWGGWPVLLVLVGSLALLLAALRFPLLAPVRRRMNDATNRLADRYVRG